MRAAVEFRRFLFWLHKKLLARSRSGTRLESLRRPPGNRMLRNLRRAARSSAESTSAPRSGRLAAGSDRGHTRADFAAPAGRRGDGRRGPAGRTRPGADIGADTSAACNGRRATQPTAFREPSRQAQALATCFQQHPRDGSAHQPHDKLRAAARRAVPRMVFTNKAFRAGFHAVYKTEPRRCPASG
jgi:hypothetical protein